MNEARVALSRINLRDSFVMAETADMFVSQLAQFANADPAMADQLQEMARASLEQAYSFGSQPREQRKPFVYQDGIAIIPVHGALLNRFGGSYSFATGYNFIRRQLNAVLEDDDVQFFALDVDCPGGESAGCFELCEEIRASRAIKPSIAVVDSLAASGGYALASSCSKMVATPSSKIGSIGVYRMHLNLKGALEQAGVQVTFIEAPEDGMKTAGNPFEALSDDAKKDFQASVNRTYDDFVAQVVANRGLDDGSVRETKARVFRADEALALRLIDEVKTPSEAVSSFMAELADEDDPDNVEDEDDMSTAVAGKPASAPAATEATSAPSQDAINAAIAADRERMTSIKALPEAAERPKLADTLALQGMSVEQSKTILASAAVETPPAPAAVETPPAPAAAAAAAPAVDSTNHLAAAMNATDQPNVGAGADSTSTAAQAGGSAQTPEDMSAAILKDQASVIGTSYAPKA